MQPDDSLLHSQYFAAWPYPIPDESIPQPLNPFFSSPCWYCLYRLFTDLIGFLIKVVYALLVLSCVLRAPSI